MQQEFSNGAEIHEIIGLRSAILATPDFPRGSGLQREFALNPCHRRLAGEAAFHARQAARDIPTKSLRNQKWLLEFSALCQLGMKILVCLTLGNLSSSAWFWGSFRPVCFTVPVTVMAPCWTRPPKDICASVAKLTTVESVVCGGNCPSSGSTPYGDFSAHILWLWGSISFPTITPSRHGLF